MEVTCTGMKMIGQKRGGTEIPPAGTKKTKKKCAENLWEKFCLLSFPLTLVAFYPLDILNKSCSSIYGSCTWAAPSGGATRALPFTMAETGMKFPPLFPKSGPAELCWGAGIYLSTVSSAEHPTILQKRRAVTHSWMEKPLTDWAQQI